MYGTRGRRACQSLLPLEQLGPERIRFENGNGEDRRQGEQIVIASYQGIGPTRQGQFKEWTVERISALGHGHWPRNGDRFAPREIIGQNVFSIIGSQAELGVQEHADEFRCCIAARQGHNGH